MAPTAISIAIAQPLGETIMKKALGLNVIILGSAGALLSACGDGIPKASHNEADVISADAKAAFDAGGDGLAAIPDGGTAAFDDASLSSDAGTTSSAAIPTTARCRWTITAG